MKLAEKIKFWPMLAVHRMAEIELVLLSFEERLEKLEPKKAEVKPDPKPEPKPDEPKPTILTPHEPPMVRLGPTPSAHDNPLDGYDNPLDGTNLRS